MTRRIFGFMIVAVLLTATSTVLAGALLTRSELERQVDRNFRRQADALATVISSDPGTDAVYLLTRRRLVLLDDRGAGADAALADRLRAAARTQPEGTVGAPTGELRYLTRETSRGRVVLARPSELRARDQRTLWGGLLIAGIAGALAAGIASIALSRRLNAPIQRVARAASQIAQGRTGVQISTTRGDELGGLVASFNSMADGIDSARAKEKQFLMSVSHDLRTPLTGIRGYAEALDEGAVDAATAAEAIQEEAQHLERLIGDLIDLARIGRHDFVADRRPVDLGEVVAEAQRRHAALADRLGVTLTAEVGGAVRVQADHGRVLQATSNLVENALRFAPAGSAVGITARDHRIAVSDAGPGLEASDLPHALDRYYLHEKYRHTRPVGTGLGLAIVSALAGAMNGRVDVRSAPGQGATFTLELPPADPAADGTGRGDHDPARPARR